MTHIYSSIISQDKFDLQNNLIKTYMSITEAYKTEKLSEIKIKKYIEDKTFVNDYYFSFTT